MLPLAWRRRRPLVVVTVICASMVLQLLAVTGYLPFLGALLPMAVANYSAAAHAPRWRLVGLALVLSTEGVILGRIAEERRESEVLFSVFVVVGTWLAGDVVRSRLARADRQMESATTLAERTTAGAAAALADERARIARELHDVIAHSVSVMGVQAAAARMLLDGDDRAGARSAVQAIETTARSSVGELQRLLEVLRADGSGTDRPGTEDGSGDLTPQPGLSMVEELVASVRSAGLPVRMQAGPTPALPAGVDLVAYRIVQEALTNTLKHAADPASTPTSVTIGVRDRQLVLEVRDAGPAAPGPATTGGHGLVGMRERVQLYGGTLEAGADRSGGFSVRAVLPFESAELETTR